MCDSNISKILADDATASAENQTSSAQKVDRSADEAALLTALSRLKEQHEQLKEDARRLKLGLNSQFKEIGALVKRLDEQVGPLTCTCCSTL